MNYERRIQRRTKSEPKCTYTALSHQARTIRIALAAIRDLRRSKATIQILASIIGAATILQTSAPLVFTTGSRKAGNNWEFWFYFRGYRRSVATCQILSF
jgi:hypothetical protein